MTGKMVLKYRLTGAQTCLLMPAGAKVLDVQMQGGDMQLWALVDTGNKEELRTFKVYGTGHPIHDCSLEYVATIQIHGAKTFVWHIFESAAQE